MKKTAKFWTLAGSVLFTAGLTAASCGGETLSVPPDIEPADAGELLRTAERARWSFRPTAATA